MQERPNLIAGFAFFKPQRDIPLAPSFIVRAGVDQPPLDAVGKQGQFLLALAEPFDNARNTPAACADANLLDVVVKDRSTAPLLPSQSLRGLKFSPVIRRCPHSAPTALAFFHSRAGSCRMPSRTVSSSAACAPSFSVSCCAWTALRRRSAQ